MAAVVPWSGALPSIRKFESVVYINSALHFNGNQTDQENLSVYPFYGLTIAVDVKLNKVKVNSPNDDPTDGRMAAC